MECDLGFSCCWNCRELLFFERSIGISLGGLAGVYVYHAVFAAQTHKGQRIWAFAREARMELRKVIWPTRPETVRTTLVVVAVVIVVALFLWGLDAFLLWAAGFLTGQRG